MKKIILFAVMLGLVGGCAARTEPTDTIPESAPEPLEETFLEGYLPYVDPDGRFQVSYPSDWSQTEGGREIQFWDDLDDGVNSVKMALIETDYASFDEVKNASTLDRGPHFTHTFQDATTNNLPTLIEYGDSDTIHYRTTYYQLDGAIFQFNAMFQDGNIQIQELARTVQDSFQQVDK